MEEAKLLNIIKEINEHENFMKLLNHYNTVYKGYLIDDELMQDLKSKIHYEELKNHFQDESYISNVLKSEKLANHKNLNFIYQSKFESIQELEKALNENKKYWIIKFSLWKLICIKGKENDKGISFTFNNKEIILKLKEGEKKSYIKNNGIIEKSSIIIYTVSKKQNVFAKCEEVQMNKKGVASRNYKLNNKEIDQSDNNNKIIINEGNDIKHINASDAFDSSKLDSLCCINCKSKIKLESIDFNFENSGNLIKFECNGNCGKKECSIDDFLKQFVKNTYLYEKCALCSKKQLDELQGNKSFIYCINCKNIICNECKSINNNICKHDNFVLTKEIKNTCIIHNNYFCCYCNNHKKQLCGECLIQDCHMNCNKIEMNKITSTIISDEEIKIFKYIIQDFKNKKNSNKNYLTTESEIRASYKKININYFNDLKNISFNIVEEIYSALHILEEEEENIKINQDYIKCMEAKFKSFDNFFNDLNNIKIKYQKELEKIKEKFITNEEEINKIKKEYNERKEDDKAKYDIDLNEININFNKEVDKIKIINDNYENQIKLGEIIFNTYSECKFNYFNLRNMYNLMSNYYRNTYIYENIVLKYLNNNNNLILLTKQKANTTFEDFINNYENKFILKNIKNPPLIGLKNINFYCFMNPILQCFCHITKFVEFFKNNNRVLEVIESCKNNNRLNLSSSFKYLIDILWPSANDFTKNKQVLNNDSNKYFCPYNIKDKIENMNALLNSRNINTSKDLFIFIILTLHEELNKNMNLISLVLEPNKKIDEKNEIIMRNNFIKNFKRENLSLISDIFYAMKEIIFYCNSCKTYRYNFKKYFYLDFHLNSILKFKEQNQSSFKNFSLSNNDNVITIYDCFNYETKITKTKIYCDVCQNPSSSSYKIILSFAPEILVIFINRLEGFNPEIKFQFYEELYLGMHIQIKEVGFCYKLIGVVATHDNSIMEKHFFAFCKNPIDSKWYKYDDDKVSNIVNVNQEILNNNIPYILFYQNTKSNA